MSKLIVGVIAFAALVACGSQPGHVTTLAVLDWTPTPNLNATATTIPQLIPISVPSLTSYPTATPQPFFKDGGALPEGALMRIGIGYINTAAVSPNGEIIAVGTSTGIYLYDANDLSLIWRRYTENPVMGIEWSPDGTRLMLADYWNSYVEPSIWDAATGRKISSLEGAWQMGAWSPDGQWIAATLLPQYVVTGDSAIPQSARVGIFYPETGKAYRRFTIDDAYFFNSVLRSLDRRQLAVRDNNSNFVESPDTYIIDSTSGDVVAQLQRGASLGDRFPARAETSPSFYPKSLSPDGKILATYNDDGTIDVGSHTIGSFIIAGESIFSWFGDSRKLVIAHIDGLTIVDAPTGEVLQGFSTFDSIDGSGWLPDSDTLLIESGNTQQALRVSTGTLTPAQFTPFRFAYYLEPAKSPDGTLVAQADDHPGPFADGAIVSSPGNMESGRVYVTDASGNKLLWERTFKGRSVGGIAWSPDGRLLALGSQLTRDGAYGGISGVTGLAHQEILVVDASTGQTLITLAGHSGDVFTLAFSPDGSKLASASSDGTVIVWPISH